MKYTRHYDEESFVIDFDNQIEFESRNQIEVFSLY